MLPGWPARPPGRRPGRTACLSWLAALALACLSWLAALALARLTCFALPCLACLPFALLLMFVD